MSERAKVAEFVSFCIEMFAKAKTDAPPAVVVNFVLTFLTLRILISSLASKLTLFVKKSIVARV